MNVIIGIILFCVAIFLVAWGLYEVGKKQIVKDRKLEAEYCKFYNEIISEIEWRAISEHNRDILRYKLNKLSAMEWKNKECTQVAYTEFMRKFYTVEDLRDKLTDIEVKRLEEHSPESIFGI